MFGDLTDTTNQNLSATSLSFSDETENSDIELQNYANRENAVLISDAYKNYGPVVVLQDFKMIVPKGVIYALLGASGCGKTTLLGCLVGRKILVSGHVSVLGKKPGSEKLTNKIGYMPQETGLHRGFTIMEILTFFGRVLGMQTSLIKSKSEFLVELLMLPGLDHKISELSGGQQRRVSLAIALLHEPELLILDEPTVGVDPIVREIIWKHFLDITKTKNVTIIVTTHYIEETSQADIVGFMRGGYLIAEDNPKSLLRQYETTSLEEVFLKLSVAQNSNEHKAVVDGGWSKNYFNFKNPSIKFNHVKALMWKHWLWLSKNFDQVSIFIILPVFLISMFFLAIGRDPINLEIAVVNGETEYQNCDVSCDSNDLGCSYLKYLEQRGLILIPYQTENDAIKSVQKGQTSASIVIKQNYSQALHRRAQHWYRVNVEDLEQSTIDVFKDVSNKHISLFIEMYLHHSYENFSHKYLDACNLNHKLLGPPLQFNSVYHGTDPNFTDFCAPADVLITIFTLALLLSAYTMLLEKNEASLERTLVVGVNKHELVLSHAIVQLVIIAVQVVLMMICTFAIFGLTAKGSLVLVAVMLLLTGFAGICFGLLISCVCDSETGVTAIAMALFFSTVLTSGLIWPIEALHPWLKPFTTFFPLMKPADSLRNILHRGWGFFYKDVYVGFLSISAWSIVLSLINIFFLKL